MTNPDDNALVEALARRIKPAAYSWRVLWIWPTKRQAQKRAEAEARDWITTIRQQEANNA